MSDARLRQISVGPSTTIREAMIAIDVGGVELALVVEGGVLVGIISDGDIRRALLGGATLDSPASPHWSSTFTSVPPGTDRVSVLDLMQAVGLSEIPVIDESGSLHGLHVMRELLGPQPQDALALILAGGLGSRLRPFTDDLPKPMLPVAGRPLLERLVLQLLGDGIRDIVLAVNYRAEVIEEHFGDGSRYGCSITYVRESPARPLGTAGCVAEVAGALGDRPLLALNGDLLLQFSSAAILAAHRGAWATVGVRDYSHVVPFGVLEVADGQLLSFREKPIETWSVSAGVYVLSPEAVASVPPSERLDMSELISRGLREERKVVAHHLEGDWMDVGRPEDLGRARGQW